MRKALHILSLAIMLALTACTHNNGDIGSWFGTWHVESITRDGAAVETGGDFFFQFQSTVFRVSLVGDHEQTVESFGTWDDHDGSAMTVDFPDQAVFYIQMPGLETHNEFTLQATSRRATLTKVDAGGSTYCYHIKKQP